MPSRAEGVKKEAIGFNKCLDLCQTAIDKALNEAADQVGGGIIRRNKRRGMEKIEELLPPHWDNCVQRYDNSTTIRQNDKINELVNAVNDLRQRVEEGR